MKREGEEGFVINAMFSIWTSKSLKFLCHRLANKCKLCECCWLSCFSSNCWIFHGEVGPEVEAVVGAGAGALFVDIDEIQDMLTETEADQGFHLNCVEILPLVDAGEVINVTFFMRVNKLTRTTGMVDIEKVEAQIIPLCMIQEIIH